MKCPICDGVLDEKTGSIRLGSEEVAYSTFKCQRCKESLVFDDEANRLFKELANLKKQLHFSKSIGYSGNSLVLRIPAKLAEVMGIHKGSKAEIIAQDKGFYVGMQKSG